MNLFQLLQLAWKLHWREWRSGALLSLTLALAVAVISHSSIGFFSQRLSTAMETQTAELVGGDLVLKSTQPITESPLQRAQAMDLTTSQMVTFSSVVMTADALQLSSVKAVSDNYPLLGKLQLRTQIDGPIVIRTSGPGRGKIWLEARLLAALNAKLGDRLQLGKLHLQVSAVLVQEPDRSGGFYALSPRLLMHLDDVPATELIQPGSRVEYRYAFAGAADKIARLRAVLEPDLLPSQKILSVSSERPQIANALGRAQSYLGLTALMAVLLASLAIAISARRYAQDQFDPSALLRCLGLTRRELLLLHSGRLVILALTVALPALLAGLLIQQILCWLLQDFLPANFPAPGLQPVWTSLLLSVCLLLAFSLPSLLQLARVSPLRVLRQQLAPLPINAYLLYVAALLVIGLMLWLYSGSLWLSLLSLLTLAVIALVGQLLVRALLQLLLKLGQLMPPAIGAAIRSLSRRRAQAGWQTLAFAMTLMIMSLVLLLRTDLLQRWQAQLPERAPNHFVMNLLPAETAAFKTFLETEKINSNPLYPISRGRLTHINGAPIKEAVSKEAANSGALNRELSLTSSVQLPSDNQLVAGRWWPSQPLASGLVAVSVEQALAKRLGIKLGDRLGFTLTADTLTAQVTSLRSVRWDSFNPNFYMIFAPESLAAFPTTYITSFYLPEDRPQLLRAIAEQFPAASVLQVDALLNQVRQILTQVTLAIEMMLALVLLAGFAVAIAALQASLDERTQEGALLRTLGASSQQIRRNNWIEFGTLGLVAGLLALLGTELLLWFCYQRFFQLEYQPHWWLWGVLPLVSTLSFALLGQLSSRVILAESPISLLRRV